MAQARGCGRRRSRQMAREPAQVLPSRPVSGDEAQQRATTLRSSPWKSGQRLSAESVPRVGAVRRSLCPGKGWGLVVGRDVRPSRRTSRDTYECGSADQAGLHLRACHHPWSCSCVPWRRPSEGPASERHLPACAGSYDVHGEGPRPSASVHLQRRGTGVVLVQVMTDIDGTTRKHQRPLCRKGT